MAFLPIQHESQSLIESTANFNSSTELSDPDSAKETLNSVFLKFMLFGNKLHKEESAKETTERSEPSMMNDAMETKTEVDGTVPVKGIADKVDATDGDSHDRSRDASSDKPSDDSQSESSSFELLLPALVPGTFPFLIIRNMFCLFRMLRTSEMVFLATWESTLPCKKKKNGPHRIFLNYVHNSRIRGPINVSVYTKNEH